MGQPRYAMVLQGQRAYRDRRQGRALRHRACRDLIPSEVHLWHVARRSRRNAIPQQLRFCAWLRTERHRPWTVSAATDKKSIVQQLHSIADYFEHNAMANEAEQHRRDFLMRALGLAGITLSATTVSSILSSCETTETAPSGRTFLWNISQVSELASPGGIISRTITGLNGDRPVFVSRLDQTTFAVFDTTCTHAGCEVSLPNAPGGNCICPCHAAQFSPRDGSVLVQPNSGSATNLKSYRTSFDASKNELLIYS
ncbi:MAG: Rieske 2Fe-2S domain-containing protein [Candidatus Kapabacteria bacterium]|nr:Rieske 2Fe-2S domain-containing protein [Candidatus Kapabacteria bacterium]